MERPKVGVGVIVKNDNGEILLGLRCNSHGEGCWAFPGGHLEAGESFVNCAAREVFEETGLEVEGLRCAGVTNDIFINEDKHYITVYMEGRLKKGELVVREPDKCREWKWFPKESLPSPLFLTISNLLKCDPCNSLYASDFL